MILSIFSSKLKSAELEKVQQISNKLGIEPNTLLAVMYFETAKTLSPKKTNGIGSVGLIQFTRDKSGVNYKTIKGRRYTLASIKEMTFIEQMDLVYEYFDEVRNAHKVNFKDFMDVYFAVFFPMAIGKNDSYVLETKYLTRSIIARQNPIFDINKDKKITKSEVVKYFSKYYGSLFNEIQKKNLNNNNFMTKFINWLKTHKKYIFIGLGVFIFLGILGNKLKRR